MARVVINSGTYKKIEFGPSSLTRMGDEAGEGEIAAMYASQSMDSPVRCFFSLACSNVLKRVRVCVLGGLGLLSLSSDATAECLLEFSLPIHVAECIGNETSCDPEPELVALSKDGNLEAKYYLAGLIERQIREGKVEQTLWNDVLELYKDAADGGFVLAQRDFGLILYRAERFDSALGYLLEAASCGVRGAAPMALSDMYRLGLGVPIDERKSACWAEFAARIPSDADLRC
ncbi:hypothetical protein A8950_3865 [Dongia mobilis]|uniref:Sel1 repeat-containing protein n=1 Tax=Dongia mobilis TaxID=578943 RepID=A0A4R6WGZ8_9PROT|nr:sel1 repeat family protein [Dongia mobilis]TDQ77710.1 hypothetical protein A8950_3865 [Dongia mobilis]